MAVIIVFSLIAFVFVVISGILFAKEKYGLCIIVAITTMFILAFLVAVQPLIQ